MTDPAMIADQIDNGADCIEHNGWWQSGDLASAQVGAQCLILSIDNGNPDLNPIETLLAQRALIDYLGLDSMEAAYEWNDAPGRTKQQVLDVMRGCAARQRMLAEAMPRELVTV